MFKFGRKPGMFKIMYPGSDVVFINKSKRKKKRNRNRSTKTSDSPRGIPFQDPLEKYLDMLHRLRKRNAEDTSSSRKSESNKSIKLKKKKKKKSKR